MMQIFEKYFSAEDREDIRLAIMNAELDTSGEIRVHVEDVCRGEPGRRAKKVFCALNMDQTSDRVGVLFYLAVSNRKFSVIADKGIKKAVAKNFWDEVNQILLNNFREDNFAEGLCLAIARTGELLKNHFPRATTDLNELPDDISFGDLPDTNVSPPSPLE